MPKYKSMAEVPPQIISKVEQYFSNIDRSTFVIKNLPPELAGGVLARYSRAPTSMRLTLINEFLDEHGDPSQAKGSELMDRVLNAFGDDSVGELEGAHVGVEHVSQLLTKYIEDRRVGGSPIEQSTRYVMYDQKDDQGRWRYLRPQEVVQAGLLPVFEKVNDRAFEVYSKGVELLKEYFKKELPREKFAITVEREGIPVQANEKDLKSDEERQAFKNAYAFTIRCAALDVGRCVLPSSTLTQLGLFGNGRFYSHLLTHLKSQDLAESKSRGSDLEAELNTQIPTFIKRNHVNKKWAERDAKMTALARSYFSTTVPESDSVTLLPRTSNLDEVTAAALFPFTNVSLGQIYELVRVLRPEYKMEILDTYIGSRDSRRDRSGRALESGYPFTFDLVGGFAEYRDLERHRVLTQQRQSLTTDLGFIMPPEMGIVGVEAEVKEVLGLMENLNSDLRHAGLTQAAQYATLFNHRIRFMMGMNLREFQHLAELRTQPAGHFSYRGMVMEMAQKVIERDPWTKSALSHVDYSDPGNKISRAKEQSKIAGKNLAKGVDGGSDLT